MSRPLRTGFTTGTAATAAAQAALALLLGRRVEAVEVNLPAGGGLLVKVVSVRLLAPGQALATVVKDAGDDPDVTHHADIQAQVRLEPRAGKRSRITIKGGSGVGRVTKPGLELAVGQPAINPVPRKMIRAALRQLWRQQGPAGEPLRCEVTILVPQGQRLATHTLNPRLGISGGISILGTTGLVKPFSHEAYVATIDSGLAVARAAGLAEVVLTTGRRSEKQAMALRPDLAETAFIQMADFFAHALKAAGRTMTVVGVVSFFGKAVKQAQALACTHARQGSPDLARLGDWLEQAGAPPALAREVAGANTARHALEVLRQAGCLDLAAALGPPLLAAMRKFAGPAPGLWLCLLDYDGSLLHKAAQPGERQP